MTQYSSGREEDPISREVEEYLERVADPGRQAHWAEYEATATRERIEMIQTLFSDGCLQNQIEHDGRAYEHLDVLPILSEEGEFAHPLSDLLQNRLQLNADFAGLAGSHRRFTGADIGGTYQKLHEVLASDCEAWMFYYYADYLTLNYTAQYVHGFKHAGRDRMKRRDQIEVMAQMAGDTPSASFARQRVLRALDILVPEGGFSNEELESAEGAVYVAEYIAERDASDLTGLVKNVMYEFLIQENTSDRVENTLHQYQHHDDYEELVKLLAIVLADEDDELYDVFESRILWIADRMGIDDSFLNGQLEVLYVVARYLRKNMAGRDDH